MKIEQNTFTPIMFLVLKYDCGIFENHHRTES